MRTEFPAGLSLVNFGSGFSTRFVFGFGLVGTSLGKKRKDWLNLVESWHSTDRIMSWSRGNKSLRQLGRKASRHQGTQVSIIISIGHL
jgi:hypothetical protein